MWECQLDVLLTPQTGTKIANVKLQFDFEVHYKAENTVYVHNEIFHKNQSD